jgi:putative transcriptional regulator
MPGDPKVASSKTLNTTSTIRTSYLRGKLLLAMPNMGDPRFERAVICMCEHNEEGAMGIVVNQPSFDMSFQS